MVFLFAYKILVLTGILNDTKIHNIAVEYVSRDWRPRTLLRFVTHCTAQFHTLANEQVVALLKAYKYSSEQKSDFDYSKQRRFCVIDKQCRAVVNKLVYSTDSQLLNQNITQLINYCCLTLSLPRRCGYLRAIKAFAPATVYIPAIKEMADMHAIPCVRLVQAKTLYI